MGNSLYLSDIYPECRLDQFFPVACHTAVLYEKPLRHQRIEIKNDLPDRIYRLTSATHPVIGEKQISITVCKHGLSRSRSHVYAKIGRS